MRTFDLRDTIISFSLLEISNAFKDMKQEEVMEINCKDPESRLALFKILPASLYEIIRDEKIEGANPWLRIRLRKKV